MTIRRWDLNGPVYNGMWSYNQAGIAPVSVPETEIERRSSIEESGFGEGKEAFCLRDPDGNPLILVQE